MAKQGKKYVRRDGFRDISFGYFRITDRKTEDDARKRIVQKRPMTKKK